MSHTAVLFRYLVSVDVSKEAVVDVLCFSVLNDFHCAALVWFTALCEVTLKMVFKCNTSSLCRGPDCSLQRCYYQCHRHMTHTPQLHTGLQTYTLEQTRSAVVSQQSLSDSLHEEAFVPFLCLGLGLTRCTYQGIKIKLQLEQVHISNQKRI